jgi:thymidylate synthase (FAD)
MGETMEVHLVAYTQFSPKYVGYDADDLVALAMRSCHSKKAMHELINQKEKKETARRIRFAKKVEHFSVLEHANFTFSISGISRICSHQLVRHRLASYSQISIRAVDPEGLNTVLPPTISGEQVKLFKKQGKSAREVYRKLIKAGVPREDARFVLPMGVETHIVVTMNARELLHFCRLRTDERAQWEIRELASRMLALAKQVAPVIFENVPETI